MAKKQIRDLLRAQPTDGRFRMADVDPASQPGLKGGKQRLSRDVKAHQAALFGLHERLYAERKRSVLVVLQAMDTGGKDGTVTHVVGHLNPQGVVITAFKAPTADFRPNAKQPFARTQIPSVNSTGH